MNVPHDALSPDRHLVVQLGSRTYDIHGSEQGPHVLIQTGTDRPRLTGVINGLFESLRMNYTAKEVGVCVLDPENALGLEESNVPYCVCCYHGADSWKIMLHYMREEYQRRQQALQASGCNSQAEYMRKAVEAGDVAYTMPHLVFLLYMDTPDGEQLEEFISRIRIARGLGFHLILLTPDAGRAPASVVSNCRLQLDLTGDGPAGPEGKYDVFEADQDVEKANLFWEWTVRSPSGKEKPVRLIRGDLTELQGPCDIVVCSAFKNEYTPTPNSLIGALHRKGYDLRWIHRQTEREQESRQLFDDGKAEQCIICPDGWISTETGLDYRRIACIELLDLYKDDPNSEDSVNLIIKKSFSTLRYMLEQASYSGIPVRSLAMTVPGTGNQGIKLCYMLAPLIAHCRSLLENDIVDEITIYNWGMNAVTEIAPAFDQAFRAKQNTPDVFISYSSKQQQTAHEICDSLERNGIRCWIAPESIPGGADYLELIPDAISSVKLILLILTPDAVKSGWVRRELTSAVGACKGILPYKLMEFEVDRKFMFLLDGDQFMLYRNSNAADGEADAELISRVRELLES